MGYNLTNERIQDTYEQLVQISGSKLLDGTGSLITPDIAVVSSSYATKASSADTATSASYALVAQTALNAQDAVTTTTFNAYTSSVSSSFATVDNQIASLEAGSGSADWTLITNKPSGLVSSSAQTIKNISGSLITPSQVNAGAVSATTFIGGNSIISGQVSATNVTATSLTASSGVTIGGNLSVAGTASFAYLQSITGSAKVIGDAFIILNADTPAQRYAGIKVYDSGSSPVSTGSFIWDSVNNDWFYEYEKDATDYAVALFGPEFSTKGTPTYPGNNVIQKGTGGHHLTGSIMTDDGTEVNIDGRLLFPNNAVPIGNQNFQPTNGSVQIGYNALTATGQNQVAIGYGADGYGESNIAIGNDASVGQSGTPQNYSIAIGNDAKVYGDYSLQISLDDSSTNTTGDQTINIGKDINNQNGYSTAIGHNLTNNGTGGNVLIGRSITTSGDYSIGIGEGANAGSQGAVAIGQSANSAGNSVAIGAGATMGSSYGFAGGYNAAANNDASIAIGGDVSVSSNQAIAIGTDTSIDGSSQGAVSFGQNADIATSTRAVVIGQGAGATGANNAIAIGSGSKVTAANEINIGGVFKYDGSISASIEDNLTINGQINTPTFAGSVASSTSSIDFDNGNFATLSLTAGTFLASPSSLKSGTTYTIIISSGSLVSGHGTAWKFSGGTAPTYTNGTDVLTCVSDGTNLYATALTDFQ